MRTLLIACTLLAASLACFGGKAKTNDDRVYKPGPGVTPARAIFMPSPKMPERAQDRSKKHKKFTGTLAVSGVVGKDGKFHNARIVHSLGPDIDGAALKAVEQWKFDPCTHNGSPVNCAMTLKVTFHLH